MKAHTRAVTLAIAAAFLFVGVLYVDLDDQGIPAPFEAPAWQTVRSTAVPSAVEFSPGFGNFTYHDDGDNANRPVNVYYYRPDTFPGSNPEVVFTMHGSERNALSARDRMVPYADRYDALLIAPEFSTAFYPDADDYNRGFVKDGGGTGNLRSRSDWTFLTVEELFDVVEASIPGAPSTYSIQGNSAAGQFISRLALVVPEARFDIAAGSNGGWYTLPTSTELYPNGIGDLDISDADVAQVYSKKLVITVGENDTDPNSYDLTHDAFTDAQGINRYERALFYHNYTRADAAARGVPFDWDLLVVGNVGHDAELMAHATAGAVFAGATTPADLRLSAADDAYIDESNPSTVFGAGLELRVDGGSHEKTFFKFDLSSVGAPAGVALLRLYITNGASGKQFVHAVSDTSWSESTLTWNNAPALGQEIGMTTGGERDGILYVEVTDYINEKIGGLASLALQSEDTDQLYFRSREAPDFPAQLVLFRVGAPPPFDFSVAVSPSAGSASPGGSLLATVTATLLSGTSEIVTFSCADLPAGADCAFVPPTSDPTGSSGLTISTSPGTPTGTHLLRVIGTAPVLSREAIFTLTVSPTTEPVRNPVAGLAGASMGDVVVSWDPPENLTGVLHYSMYVGTDYDPDGAGYAFLGTTPLGGTSYVHAGAGRGDLTTYYYRVLTNSSTSFAPHPRQTAKFGQALAGGAASLLSLPIEPNDASLPAVLASVAAEVELVRAYNPSDAADPWKAYYPGRGGDLTAVRRGVPLWVHTRAGPAVPFALTGWVEPSTTLSLQAGWNLVALTADAPVLVATALAGVPYLGVEGFDAAAAPYWLRALGPGDLLRPGTGYWIQVATASLWTVAFDAT